uniref:Ig-like domain-containing protein n=1 Tax=Podarcis muralis TaxID=64176 RepID=A0A670K633_PODMU
NGWHSALMCHIFKAHLTDIAFTVKLPMEINFLCAASDFYPGNVSVKWLRGSETLKVDSPPVQQGPDGLFYAESVLEFTPQISDSGVTFSCHIHHQARKDPISQDFELNVVGKWEPFLCNLES